MKKKLKPLKQILKENRHYKCDEGYRIIFNDMKLLINRKMYSFFGKSINVEPITNHSKYHYTSIGEYRIWYFHELWFGNKDFIEEDEFKI